MVEEPRIYGAERYIVSVKRYVAEHEEDGFSLEVVNLSITTINQGL